MINALELLKNYQGADLARQAQQQQMDMQSQLFPQKLEQGGLQNQLLRFNLGSEQEKQQRERMRQNMLAQLSGGNALFALDPKLAIEREGIQSREKIARERMGQMRVPPGFRPRADGGLEPIPGGPEDWRGQPQPGMTQTGQPQVQNSIFGNVPNAPPPMSPRDAAMMYRQNVESGQKQLEKESEAMSNLSPIEDRLKRWRELNSGTMTGPVSGYRPGIFNPEFQELKQLENWFSANNFKPGQGQISNYERAMIKQSGPNTLYDKETNDRIITLQQSAVQNMKDRNQFKQAYLERKGSLLGSDAAWQKYLDSNPRYIESKDGNLIENPKWSAWTQWKGENNAPIRSPGASNVPAGWKIEEVK